LAVILTVIGRLAITLLLTAMVMVQVNQLAKGSATLSGHAQRKNP